MQAVRHSSLETLKVFANDQQSANGHAKANTHSEQRPTKWNEQEYADGNPENDCGHDNHHDLGIGQSPKDDPPFDEPVGGGTPFSSAHSTVFH